MWNGYVEQRVLVWNSIQWWETFEKEAVADEERRLKLYPDGKFYTSEEYLQDRPYNTERGGFVSHWCVLVLVTHAMII